MDGMPRLNRIASIDALRGLTIAFMILVNDPGDWGHVYWPLDHAEWNGFTPTDLVFPTFLFLVGCSLVLSVRARLARGVARGTIALSMLRRAGIIVLLDLFLAAYPHFHLTHLRIYGVLTRIALCYLAAGLIFLYVRSAKALAIVTVALLIGYWALLRLVPVPGAGMPVRDFAMNDPVNNLTAWIDRGVTAWCQSRLHTGRLYLKTSDPEGLLSTLPAVATALLGVLAALWLLSRHTAEVIRRSLMVAGLVALTLGRVWNAWFPVNKNLWTSSFVLYAGGWSILLLALFFWLFDDLRVQERTALGRAVVWPMLVFGANAITAYVVSELLVESLLWWKLPAGGSAWRWLYQHGFAFHGSNENTSLAFALAYVVVCFAPNWILWRRGVFLKV
jgi:predicted acyltransferase